MLSAFRTNVLLFNARAYVHHAKLFRALSIRLDDHHGITEKFEFHVMTLPCHHQITDVAD